MPGVPHGGKRRFLAGTSASWFVRMPLNRRGRSHKHLTQTPFRYLEKSFDHYHYLCTYAVYMYIFATLFQ